MAFTKLSIAEVGANSAPGPSAATKPDIWTIFRALRDARAIFGLRPGHIHTLQAMLSFLKPGHGDTVFASNHSICQRVGGIDERTLRRHLTRFVELGFIKRTDSPNRKRYRVRSSGGECISYGLSLTPLLERAAELLALAQEVENNRRDRIFLRKQILTRLAHLEEHNPKSPFLSQARKLLRRKLDLADYRALLAATEAECQQLSTAMDMPETTKLSANTGQNDRHLSKSEERNKDLEESAQGKVPEIQTLTAVCDQATSFTLKQLRSWGEVENHARSLAPMMGIAEKDFEKARQAIGGQKAACAVFIVLQLGKRIRDFAAYFHSITVGKRQHQFNPVALVTSLAKNSGCMA